MLPLFPLNNFTAAEQPGSPQWETGVTPALSRMLGCCFAGSCTGHHRPDHLFEVCGNKLQSLRGSKQAKQSYQQCENARYGFHTWLHCFLRSTPTLKQYYYQETTRNPPKILAGEVSCGTQQGHSLVGIVSLGACCHVSSGL